MKDNRTSDNKWSERPLVHSDGSKKDESEMIKCGLGTCAWSLLLPAQPPALSVPTPQPGQVSDRPPEIMCCRASEAEMRSYASTWAGPWEGRTGTARLGIAGTCMTDDEAS